AITSSAKYSDIAAPSRSFAARAHVFAARRSSSLAPDCELKDTVGLAPVEDAHAPNATPAASNNPIGRPRTRPRRERSACANSTIRFITMLSPVECLRCGGPQKWLRGRGAYDAGQEFVDRGRAVTHRAKRHDVVARVVECGD